LGSFASLSALGLGGFLPPLETPLSAEEALLTRVSEGFFGYKVPFPIPKGEGEEKFTKKRALGSKAPLSAEERAQYKIFMRFVPFLCFKSFLSYSVFIVV